MPQLSSYCLPLRHKRLPRRPNLQPPQPIFHLNERQSFTPPRNNINIKYDELTIKVRFLGKAVGNRNGDRLRHGATDRKLGEVSSRDSN